MSLLNLSVAVMMILVLRMPAVVAGETGVTKSPPPGCSVRTNVKTPKSSVEKPGDVGKRAHTNIEVLVPCPPQSPLQPRGESQPKSATPPH